MMTRVILERNTKTPIQGDALLGQPLAGQFVTEVYSKVMSSNKNPRMMSANPSVWRLWLSRRGNSRFLL
jgi:hypothetical protein